MRSYSMTLVAFLWVGLWAGTAAAQLKVAVCFSDHMVFQRDIAVPIWGVADAGDTVTVEFAGRQKVVKAGDKGQWRVNLDAMPASAEPRELVVRTDKSTLTLRDVLVGEVWLGSGQSNMAMQTPSYTNGDPVLAKLAAGTYPQLRLLLRRGRVYSWEEANPETIAGFSALMFAFGQPLQAKLGVPVGLMVGAVGGTPSGQWLTEEMYRSDAASTEAVQKFAATDNYDARKAAYDAARSKYEEDLASWKVLAEAAKAEGKAAPQAPRAPARVVPAGEMMSGRFGELYDVHIRPLVGYGIRGVLWDQGESGTAVMGLPQVTLMGALIKGWRKDWGQGDFPWLYVQKPSGGGPAWDYENPVTSAADKFAELPTELPAPPAPLYSSAEFLKIMAYPKSYMVVSSDLGPGTHPINKSGYGVRAGRVAMAVVYGAQDEWMGPLYASHQVEGQKVRIRFIHVGKGLAVRHSEKAQGFLLAGDDKQFKWADAVIEGDSVVVSHPTVTNPAAVRYAWSNRFPWANLFNKDGLPAQPFRTDNW